MPIFMLPFVKYWGQFNKAFECNSQVWLLFLDLKTMATLENYSCKSFIEVTPNKNSK